MEFSVTHVLNSSFGGNKKQSVPAPLSPIATKKFPNSDAGVAPVVSSKLGG